MKKKSQATDPLLIIIVAVAVGLILLVFFVYIFKGQSAVIDVEKCRFSVLAQANVPEGKSLLPLNCPRRIITFYNDHVEIGNTGKKGAEKYELYIAGEKTKSFDRITADIVNQIYAEELRICWYQMGEGNQDIFKEKITKNYNMCLICAEMNFDENVKTDEFKGLGEYLNKNIPYKQQKYIDYLSKTVTGEKSWWGLYKKEYTTLPVINSTFSISTKDKNVILFNAFKPNWLWSSSWISALPNKAFGMEYNDFHTVYPWKANDLANECNILYN